MPQYPIYDRGVRGLLAAGDHLDRVVALVTGFDVDLEHTFEALGPGHGDAALGAVGREHSMETVKLTRGLDTRQVLVVGLRSRGRHVARIRDYVA